MTEHHVHKYVLDIVIITLFGGVVSFDVSVMQYKRRYQIYFARDACLVTHDYKIPKPNDCIVYGSYTTKLT